jgi:hypothetical protein
MPPKTGAKADTKIVTIPFKIRGVSKEAPLSKAVNLLDVETKTSW